MPLIQGARAVLTDSHFLVPLCAPIAGRIEPLAARAFLLDTGETQADHTTLRLRRGMARQE